MESNYIKSIVAEFLSYESDQVNDSINELSSILRDSGLDVYIDRHKGQLVAHFSKGNGVITQRGLHYVASKA